MQIALETVGITKKYGDIIANRSIDLKVQQGEAHAIMGENGAGKSTLMGVLYGLVRPDSGQIIVSGRETIFRSPVEAIRGGLGMVHQAFMLFESLTVWENVVYGAERTRGFLLNARSARARVAELAERFGMPVDPDARIDTLSVGVRQRVEILKALYREVDILILDEPTAVLTPLERDALFEVIKSLKENGKTVLLVTHKLHEVMVATDRVTVLRDGANVASFVTKSTTPDEIIHAMTGRTVKLVPDRTARTTGDTVLRVDHLTVRGGNVRPMVDDASFAIRAGEIVGIAGVAGNGQTELIEAIVGLRSCDGQVEVSGSSVTGKPVAQRRDAGIAYIPEDRARTGTAAAVSAAENLNMGFHRQAPQAVGRLYNRRAVSERARTLIQRFGVKIKDEKTRVGTLSGGNLQKIVVARELDHTSSVIIAEQPTRGVDVGAIEFIHAQLMTQRMNGWGILLVSSELWEIMGLCDRVHVMFEGRLLPSVPVEMASEQLLGALMAGGDSNALDP